MKHRVISMYNQTAGKVRLVCSCHKVITGRDEIECGRKHDLHVIRRFQKQLGR